MSLENLTDKEKNLLLQLSYLDIPPELEISDARPRNIQYILDEIKQSGIEYDEDRLNNIQKYLDANSQSPLQDVKLTGYANHNPNEANNTNGASESGFVGYAVKDEDGNGAVMFRGSESPGNWDHLRTDWAGNVAAGVSIETKQHEEALAFYQNYMVNVDGQITIFGHSKGGNLGTYVFVNDGSDNVNAYIVNGAPLWWFDLTDKQKEDLKGDRFTFVTYEGDFVSHLGYAPYVDQIVRLNKEHGEYADPFYPHYETSVTFNDDGSLANSMDPDKWMVRDLARDLYYSFGSAAVNLANAAVDQVREAATAFVGGVREVAAAAMRQAREVAMAISSAALNIIYTTWKGMVDAANYVREQTLRFVSRVQNLGRQLVANAGKFLDTVANRARSLFSRAMDFISGGSFPVEPFIKVDISRLLYYANRLRALQQRTARLNDMIDDLYWEAGVMGLDNVLKADISSSFDIRIPESVNYLNRTAELLQRSETMLAGKASSIGG
ncbi:MAG: Mbeg1-like protein [Mesobacillus sp.]|uniref:Mbeg1-like protein n=1 Tax=Mesobacillus sp. TaxID=2675271 RepID=UPI003C625258